MQSPANLTGAHYREQRARRGLTRRLSSGQVKYKSCYRLLSEMSFFPLFLVFLSGIGFSTQALVIKKLTSHYDFTSSSQIVFFRGFVQLIISFFLVLRNSRSTATPLTLSSFFGAKRTTTYVLLTRATFGYIGICGSFYSLLTIPMGDSTTLIMLSTIWSSLLAVFFLGEKGTCYLLMAIPTAFVGVILIVQPSFIFAGSSLNPTGVLAAIIGSGGAAIAYICVRMLGTSSPMYWSAVTFNQGLGQTVYAVPTLYLLNQTFVWDAHIIAACCLLGVIGTASQACMTMGMQREKSALTSVMRMSDILASFCFQLAFTDETANAVTVGGAALVVSGVLIILWGKWKESKIVERSDDKLPLTAVEENDDEEDEQIEMLTRT